MTAENATAGEILARANARYVEVFAATGKAVDAAEAWRLAVGRDEAGPAMVPAEVRREARDARSKALDEVAENARLAMRSALPRAVEVLEAFVDPDLVGSKSKAEVLRAAIYVYDKEFGGPVRAQEAAPDESLDKLRSQVQAASGVAGKIERARKRATA